MGRRRKKSSFDLLAGALNGKSKRGRGLAGRAPTVTSRKRRGRRGSLADYIDLGDRVALKGSRKRGGMVREVARSLAERMTPTERQQIRDELDETIDRDEQLIGSREYSRLIQNERWYQRALRLVLDRFRKPVL